MIRFVLRFLGFLILAAGFVALIRDGARTIADNDLRLTGLGTDWTNISQNSLQLFQAWVERHAAPTWEAVAQPVLDAPTWLVCLILAAILILLGRKKRKLIGYARD